MIQKQKTQAIKSILVAWVFCFSELYFFCRVLDIRVTKVMETNLFQTVVFQHDFKMLGDEVRLHKLANRVDIDVIQIFLAIGFPHTF